MSIQMLSISFHRRAAGYCAAPAADPGVKEVVSRNILQTGQKGTDNFDVVYFTLPSTPFLLQHAWSEKVKMLSFM